VNLAILKHCFFSWFCNSGADTAIAILLPALKHILLRSTAPLKLKRFKAGSKMAIAVSTPLLPNQKKTVLQNRPIH
jgi:hypothetical protein